MSEKQSVLAGFKAFLMRGNVVELAVAVVIGAAFTKIVSAVVEGVINPVVGAIGPKDLDRYTSCLKSPCQVDPATGEAVSGITLKWGTVLSASITFVITAAVVYFLMILPMTKYKARLHARRPVEDASPAKTELDVLTEIRDALLAQRDASASPADGGDRPSMVGQRNSAPRTDG
ncbi:large conductance mechanosensitive channel protein MscL [Streptomyces sp. TRM 70351]|uniref:large conductance mechanosensitive channel protein MscL n=1 Tax=Streptomyces sp. TRM 70351 TaxID=3116552 RepID=UPI002E7B46A5|nr:large conductance mechanosensitive channel protein MscL [Streptomyces sp. TRM 70351]MEE1929500.1 large conductance mechanosensitive channel protein MscL [Streptomyces sp. TRM 70351]